jgi:RHS repeat-associated protein
MLAAAKEKITPVFPLAARLPVNQFGFVSSNSRQGFPPEIPPCIGPSTFVSSTSHWGCAPFSCDSTVARLVGLDFFGARYFSGAQGRFTSPDTPGYASLRDPQAWNLYAYALNNPLKFIDPDGHEVVCNGNTNNCKTAIAAATGNADAAARVGIKTTTTKHSFLGLFHWTTSKTTITISGDIGSFRALGQNASRLADLVSYKREFGFNASSSTYKGDPIGFWNTLLAPGERPLYGGGQTVTPSEG